MLAKRDINWFKPHANSRRKRDPDKISRLAESIRKEGLLQPLVAFEDGTLIAGYDRLDALKLAAIKEADVNIIPGPFDEGKLRLLNIVENLLRSDISVFDRCCSVVEYSRLFPEKTNKEIAVELHVDATSVTQWQSVTRVVPQVRQALADDKIGLTDMYAISHLPPEEQAGALDLKLAGATREQIRAHVRKRKNGGKPEAKVKRLKCLVPGFGATVTVASSGDSTLAGFMGVLTELVKLGRKAENEGLDTRTFCAVLADKHKANGGM
jgi:ParB-like chromosome segregation protein Spo0J